LKRPRKSAPPPFDYGAFWEDLIVDLQDPVFREQFIDVSIQLQADYQDMMLSEELEREKVTATHDEWEDCTGRNFFVHKRNTGCDINGCAIHNPSYHPLSDAKQYMRADKAWLIERICDHGIGHPDPDSASFIAKQEGNGSIWVHGCDGCCRPLKCYCGCEEGAHMGKPRGCLAHGFHEYSTKEPERFVGEPYTSKGWGPHVHYYSYGDDGIGHSGSFCSCGKEEPDDMTF